MPVQSKSTRSKKPSSIAQSVASSDTDQSANLVTVDNVTYETDALPEEIKALLRDLLRFNHEAEELQYRLRQIQAAQQTYYETIKVQIAEKGVKPYQD
jgi:predicted transcriptional regulator